VPLSVGYAGSPSNTMSPGPRPTSVPSGILIHPTIRPEYTNVTDIQTDRRDRTTVAPKTTPSHYTKLSVRINRGRSSVLSCQQCNTLCTSGLVDDVMFSHNTMGHVARGLGNNDVGAVLKQVVKIKLLFFRLFCYRIIDSGEIKIFKIPTYSPDGATLFDSAIQRQQMAHPGEKCDANYCLAVLSVQSVGVGEVVRGGLQPTTLPRTDSKRLIYDALPKKRRSSRTFYTS